MPNTSENNEYVKKSDIIETVGAVLLLSLIFFVGFAFGSLAFHDQTYNYGYRAGIMDTDIEYNGLFIDHNIAYMNESNETLNARYEDIKTLDSIVDQLKAEHP